MPKRRVIFAAVLMLTAGLSWAQPGGTMKILVGFPAGGAPDAVARAYAEQYRQQNAGTLVVENRPGASGKIAIDALLAAPADGKTMALIPASTLALIPMTIKSAKYDAVADFSAVGNVAEYGFGVATGPATDARDVAGYKAWATDHSKASSFATPGLGTPQYFIGAQLQKIMGVDLTHVPYRGGAAAVTDVVGGTVPMLITTEQLLVPYQKSGKMKTLFITSRERNPQMPEVPTAREIGLPQLESADWFGILVKAGTPAEKLQEMRAQLGSVVSSPAYKEALSKMGYSTPARQFEHPEAQLKSERAAWAARVKLANFEAGS